MTVLVRNEGAPLRLVGGVCLGRGETSVEDERWKVCVVHPMTQIFLDMKRIRVLAARSAVSKPEPVAPAPPPKDWSGMGDVLKSKACPELAKAVRGLKAEAEAPPEKPKVLLPGPNSLTARELIALIHECQDVEWLGDVFTFDRRVTVRDAAGHRLSDIEVGILESE